MLTSTRNHNAFITFVVKLLVIESLGFPVCGCWLSVIPLPRIIADGGHGRCARGVQTLQYHVYHDGHRDGAYARDPRGGETKKINMIISKHEHRKTETR